MSPIREIEVKYVVNDPDELHAALQHRGLTLTPPVVQDDQAYARAGWQYGMGRIGVPFARLRSQDGRHLFTVKTPIDNTMACDEQETEIADREQMHQAILAMGFTPTVRIVKRRRTTRHGHITLCLDEVDGAGLFLELEQLAEPDEHAADVQNRLDTYARTLAGGLHRTTDTYDTIIRRSQNVPA
ncbi:class IV adenylate cyclase [Frankia sp. AvcI1]|uniref:class IV adenylate cyclase n=1 Tax=Frankia sp. AvcI1 TaxID=573496 RepID=UPI000BA3AE38|nr:CYTH domain-containing protein [Frankia sp. AvcI1]